MPSVPAPRADAGLRRKGRGAPEDRRELVVGVATTLAVGAHLVAHVAAGHWYDMFWLCDVAALVAGPAVLLRSRLWCCAVAIWLIPGSLIWGFDLMVAPSRLMPTSILLHLGGAAAALYGVRRNGFDDRGWGAALAMLAGVVLLSRLALPSHANVNAAHGVPVGWTFLHGDRRLFTVFSIVAIGVALFAGRWVTRRLGEG